MYQMPGHSKLCATCNFWMGPRQVNWCASHVVLDEQSVKGKCFCQGGPHMRADRLSNFTTCYKYEKWSVLK